MKLATQPAGTRRASSRQENRNYPQREAAPPSLSKTEILQRLTEANIGPTGPASPAPDVSGEIARTMTLGERLDYANGLPPNYALRHRGGQ